ncbi:hypothetical protein DV735_g68, partial [Chaetothyriales sp. CBS 134920]
MSSLPEDYRKCLRALKEKASTYEEFKNRNPDREEGTCQWVLSHTQYREWHDKEHHGLLWISADPGCGKSVLVRSLVDHELQTTDQHTVCYFSFKDNDEQNNVATALCALLHQLFSKQRRLFQHAIRAWDTNGEKLVQERGELWRILMAAGTDDEAQDVTYVLDALDECQPSDRQWLINMLSKFHQDSLSLPSSRRGRLKILVTSRPYDDIRVDFQKQIKDLPTIRLRGEEENERVHEEIDMVIRIRVGELKSDLGLDSDTAAQLQTTLLEMEHRTYLWLYLAIEGIKDTYRRSH